MELRKHPEDKLLYYDLEVAPRVTYSYGNSYEPTEVEMIEDGYILAFAYKWDHEDEIKFVGMNQFAGKLETRKSALVAELWNLHNEADILVAHNGDRFDQKVSNTEFIRFGHTPPSTYHEVDTLKIARQKLLLRNNTLDEIASFLGVGGKTGHSAKKLCTDILKGIDRWQEMELYNKQDVQVLIDVHERLRGWAKSYPNRRVSGFKCPVCLTGKITKNGYKNNKPHTAEHQRWKCQSKKCGTEVLGVINPDFEKPEYKSKEHA